ncbi:MAG: peptidyl-prolyl cis-trans isomerase [Woeseiaceae bacterium]
MKEWLREPLLHFLVLGGLIFVLNNWTSEGGSDDDEIVVTLAHQQNLANTFTRTWQRPPSEAELASLIEDYIRQEIAYRESQAMQLDRDDIVIRRRLRQKLEMLAEDVVTMTPPQPVDLQQYFDDNPDAFRQPAVLSFRQVFFNADGDEGDALRRADMLLLQWQSDESNVDFLNAGDPSMLPRELDNVRVPELAAVFGAEFAEEIQKVDTGRWAGPVRSGFGVHLVQVVEKIASRMPAFDEVADLVAREWQVERRNQAIDGLYDRLAERYTITVEAPSGILPDAQKGAAP